MLEHPNLQRIDFPLRLFRRGLAHIATGDDGTAWRIDIDFQITFLCRDVILITASHQQHGY